MNVLVHFEVYLVKDTDICI